MLVLSRKLHEKLVIGDNIVITVCRIERNQVRIGIEAPGSLPVTRPDAVRARPAAEAAPGDATAARR